MHETADSRKLRFLSATQGNVQHKTESISYECSEQMIKKCFIPKEFRFDKFC